MNTSSYFFSISLLVAALIGNAASAQNGFTDDFEPDAAGSFPSNWLQSGNNAIVVDNSTAFSGTNSLKMFGVLGGCWAAVAHHQLKVGPAWQLVGYVKNGGERGTGCHPELGVIAVNTGPSWTLPNFTFLVFRAAAGETNQLQIPSPVNSSLVTVGTFNTNQWYKIKILFQPVGAAQLYVKCWLDDRLIAGNLYTNTASAPTNFTYLTIASGEGTTWFDDLAVSAPSDSAPAIVQQPSSITVFQGDSATFAVSAVGSLPLSYQWQFGNTPLPGQTNATLVLSDVQTNEAGTYSVLVTNSFGSALSSNAVLTVNLPQPISCGQTVTNTTRQSSQADVYTFNGSAGQQLALALAGGINPSYGDWMVADVYSPAGQLLGTVDGGSGNVGHALGLTVTNSGAFIIRVHESLYRATGAYSLSLQSLTGGGCGATSLSCGQNAGNATHQATEMDAFSYNGIAGQQLSLALAGGINSSYGDWMVADVYNPVGQLVGTVDGGSGNIGRNLDLTLTNSGTFTVLVHESLYRSGGAYSLSLQSVTGGGCGSATLACGQTVTNTTSRLTQMDAYSYTGTAGQQLIFSLAGGINPSYGDWMVANVYNPEGQLLGTVDGGSGNIGHNLGLTLTNSGTFTVLVHESLYRSGGAYSLSLQSVTGGGCGTTMLNCGQTVTNTTTRLTQMDAYSYTGTAGQQLIFSLAGGINPSYGDWMVADVYNPEGQLVGTVDGGSRNIGHNLGLTLTNSGTFTILVHESLYRSGGAYSLSLQSVTGGGCGTATLACGQTVTNTTSRLTQMDAYSYNGTAGQQLVFALAGGINASYGDWMVADVYNPEGQLVGTVDGGSRNIGHFLALTLAESGTFTVLVHESFYRSGGAYSLSLQSVTGGGCGTATLACGQTVTNTTSRLTQMDAYSYNGTAGQQLLFALAGRINASYGDWMVADIYSPLGQLLGTVDGGSGNIGHNLNLTLTNSGTFTVLVHESLYRSGGAYSLSLQSVTGGGCGSATLACGQTVTNTTSRLTQMDAYSYDGTAGQQLVCWLDGPINAAYDDWMVAGIYGPGGELLGTLDGGSANTAHSLALTLTNSGTFTLLVHESLYRELGKYQLSIQSVNGPAGGCGLVGPSITQQPVSLTSYIGGHASFSVIATGSTPLSYQWEFKGAPLPGETNSTLLLFGVQTNEEGSYAVVVTNLVGAVVSSNATLSINSASCYPAPPGLVAWWPADGNALDIVGGHNGQAVGSVSYTNGLSGQAFSFSGAGTIQVPDAPDLDFAPNASLTLEFWAYRTGAGDPQHFLGKRIGCIGNTDINFQMAFNMGAGEGLSSDGVQTGQPMPLNSWHHLVGSFDGTNGNFYLDGQLIGTGTGVNGPTNSAPLLIGGSGTCADFEGFMQNIRIYNRALSAEEIQSLYQAGCSGVCLSNPPNPCSDAVLGLTGTQTNTVVPLGQSVYYTLTASSVGECNPAGVVVTNQLPVGFEFVSAAAGQGTWSYNASANQVVFYLGSMSNNETLNLDIAVLPAQSGTFTNTAEIRYNSTNAPVLLTPPIVTTVISGTNFATPPFITRQPLSVITNQGTTVNFSITAAGTPPLAYQWMFNGKVIVGATNSILTLLNVQTNQDGIYAASVTNAAGATNSANATLVVIPPAIGIPIVSFTSPTNGATFAFGAGISVAVSAFETNGSIQKVVLIANTNTVLGTFTASPYNLLWTNAPVGTDYLMAVATDASDITATSTVRVVVLPPVQPPSFAGGPDITVAQNAGPQSLTNWATSISAGTPGGSLSFKVSDDNPGLFSTPPTLSSDGTLSFIPAGNAAGVAHCQVVLDCSDGLSSGPTSLTITVVAPEDVAIILASAEADPGPVTNDVAAVSLPGEQSLSFQLFQRSQLSSPVLALFKLVIWYDPDGTLPVAPAEVSLLQNLYSNGLPLVFVGPRLVSSGANLPPPEQADWDALLHLQPDGTPAISGTVNPAGASGSGTLLPSGAYGVITPFDIQTLIDEATVTPDADSDGQLGTNDVLVSFPSANAANADLLVRTFTELLPLGPDTESSSFNNRNEVLQNAICWAVHCGVCPEVFLSFGGVVDPSTPQTGQPATLGFAMGNNGECDGAAYQAMISLDPGLRLISASSDYGKVTTVSNLVTVYVGRIPARQNLNLTVTVLPVVPGWVTNQIHLQSASSSAQDLVSTFLVQGQRIPELAIQPAGPTAVLLSAWGQPGVSYVLERALLQPQGGAFVWTPLTNFIFGTPVFQIQDAIQSTNPGFMYRVRSR